MANLIAARKSLTTDEADEAIRSGWKDRYHRMGTLTYSGEERPSSYDWQQVLDDAAGFLSVLREQNVIYPSDSSIVAAEPHADGHLHVHLTLPRFVPIGVLCDAWQHSDDVDVRTFSARHKMATYMIKDAQSRFEVVTLARKETAPMKDLLTIPYWTEGSNTTQMA